MNGRTGSRVWWNPTMATNPTSRGSDLEEHPTTPSGMGIEMMRYRARALGGQLQITDGVNGGTEVRLECPSLPMR